MIDEYHESIKVNEAKSTKSLGCKGINDILIHHLFRVD